MELSIGSANEVGVDLLPRGPRLEEYGLGMNECGLRAIRILEHLSVRGPETQTSGSGQLKLVFTWVFIGVGMSRK